MSAIANLRAAGSTCVDSARVFLRDVGAGLFEVSHNSLALLGLCVVGVALFAGGRAEMRTLVEQHALGWLQARQEARDPARINVQPEPEPDAVARATAADPKALPRQQAAVAQWLSRRYKVAPEPVSRLVQEAWAVGHRVGLDPTLILAIMAIESSFNPFAHSSAGAQGLMQVMTKVHDDKYQAYGGVRAAFDPVANLRVGVQVLKECIARAGGLEAGLRYYVGAAISGEDGGYVGKVLAEQGHLRQVADGRRVAVNASNAARSPAPVIVQAVRSAEIAEAAEPVPVSAPLPAAIPSAPAVIEERVAMMR
ncbi:MAG: lytic transglycosylase [Burkholderiales bacterium RIFCSPHIGHO2_12_FULL_69_20]|nr:MAG: lytic transglycosylase [Burkholderiales bacterium RIFCSPHIGHO2_12_FULL_69_20]